MRAGLKFVLVMSLIAVLFIALNSDLSRQSVSKHASSNYSTSQSEDFSNTSNQPQWLQDQSSKCASIHTSIYDQSIRLFEPSDITWNSHTNNSFFVVSDNGLLYEMDINGSVIDKWTIGDYDLEAVLFIALSPLTIYLGVEYPAQLIHYSLSTRSIITIHDLQLHIDSSPSISSTVKNAGIESLIFLASLNSKHGGYFYAGRQSDAKLFIFEIPAVGPIIYRGSIQAPEPSSDLSAMTVHKGYIYFLYDKPRILVSVDATTPKVYPSSRDLSDTSLSIKDSIATYSFDRRGFEGIAFGEVNGVEYVFVAVDPPKNKGSKDLLRYLAADFIACFVR